MRVLLLLGWMALGLSGSAFAALANSEECSTSFLTPYNESSKLADKGMYTQAATLREESATIFQDCLKKGWAPKNGLYPFDGAGAYLIAATFWHLAHRDEKAQRDLALGKATLAEIMVSHPYGSLTESQRLYYSEMSKLIHEEESGTWGVWRDNDVH
ncbi:MAG TPA: hypothetical protein VFE16_05430 [Candidatus Cybelea sp.]|nr:hypothetical protein [Candidatus Cybelea sp.]